MDCGTEVMPDDNYSTTSGMIERSSRLPRDGRQIEVIKCVSPSQGLKRGVILFFPVEWVFFTTPSKFSVWGRMVHHDEYHVVFQ